MQGRIKHASRQYILSSIFPYCLWFWTETSSVNAKVRLKLALSTLVVQYLSSCIAFNSFLFEFSFEDSTCACSIPLDLMNSEHLQGPCGFAFPFRDTFYFLDVVWVPIFIQIVNRKTGMPNNVSRNGMRTRIMFKNHLNGHLLLFIVVNVYCWSV